MTWSKLDDTLIDHPKLVGLSDKAFRLFIGSIVYSSRHLTDGRLGPPAVRALCACVGIEAPESRATLTSELIEAGLWDGDDGEAILVHDYLDYNPSREKVEARRKPRAKAGRKGGKATAKRRRRRAATATAKDAASAGAHASANAAAGASTNDGPRPVALTEQRRGVAPPEGAAHTPLDGINDTVPAELAGLSDDGLKAHRDSVRRKLAPRGAGTEQGGRHERD